MISRDDFVFCVGYNGDTAEQLLHLRSIPKIPKR